KIYPGNSCNYQSNGCNGSGDSLCLFRSILIGKNQNYHWKESDNCHNSPQLILDKKLCRILFRRRIKSVCFFPQCRSNYGKDEHPNNGHNQPGKHRIFNEIKNGIDLCTYCNYPCQECE